MASNIPAYILDSFALIAYFQAERGGLAVRSLLESARDGRARLHLSLMNAGEIYYLAYRQHGATQADMLLHDLRTLPLALEMVSQERVFAAARIKAEFLISYADAFAVGLARELRAILVSGDPELQAVESIISLMWLPPR